MLSVPCDYCPLVQDNHLVVLLKHCRQQPGVQWRQLKTSGHAKRLPRRVSNQITKGHSRAWFTSFLASHPFVSPFHAKLEIQDAAHTGHTRAGPTDRCGSGHQRGDQSPRIVRTWTRLRTGHADRPALVGSRIRSAAIVARVPLHSVRLRRSTVRSSHRLVPTWKEPVPLHTVQ